MTQATRDLHRSNDSHPVPNRDDAAAALRLLRSWATLATPEEVATLDPLIGRLVPGQELSNYPALARRPRATS